MGSALRCFTGEYADDENGSGAPFFEPTRTFESTQEVAGAPTDRRWYFGKITHNEADRALEQGARGHEGSYLVYDNPRRRGEYVLLAMHNQKSYRWRISRRKHDGMYILGEDGEGVVGHKDVRDLIHHHRGITGMPIKLQHGGVMKLSKEYVYKTTAHA